MLRWTISLYIVTKIVVYYEEAPEKKGPGEAGTKIDKIVATGDVKIVRAEGGVATGKKAVYYQLDEKLVLTGKPCCEGEK